MSDNTENYVKGSVSKSYSRMKQTKYKGVNLKTWTVFGVWVIISLIILYPFTMFETSKTTKLFMCAVLVLFWAGYMIYGRNSSVIERSIIHFKFIFRSFKGETDIAKYVQDNRFLEKFLPIKKVHSDGFIEYLNGTWGVMLKIRATRIPGDELFFHLEGIRHLHDGLYDKIYVTIISSTVLKHDNQLIDELVSLSKNTHSVPKKEHLVDLHKMIVETNQSYKGHEISIVINLGPHSTIESANIARDGFVPGHLDALTQCNCTGHRVTSSDDVYKEYRTKLNPMGV